MLLKSINQSITRHIRTHSQVLWKNQLLPDCWNWTKTIFFIIQMGDWFVAAGIVNALRPVYYNKQIINNFVLVFVKRHWLIGSVWYLSNHPPYQIWPKLISLWGAKQKSKLMHSCHKKKTTTKKQHDKGWSAWMVGSVWNWMHLEKSYKK